MATCSDLSEAFFNSFIYWLQNDAILVAQFSNRVYLAHPDLNLTMLTLPFVVVNYYDTADDIDTQPDMAESGQSYESRNIRYLFTIGVYCTDFKDPSVSPTSQRVLPHLVKREIEKETTVRGSLTEQGFQVWKGFTTGIPDTGTELCVAEPILGGPYPLGGEPEKEEDEVMKWRSMIDGYFEVQKDKAKVFISTDS